MATNRVIVAGSSSFKDYELLKSKLDFYLKNTTDIEIVSGQQVTTNVKGEKYGADYLGEQYAKENKIPLKLFPADWKQHGKKAGYLRNEEMAKYATHCICFWDGKSKGTAMMMRLAKQYKLHLRIVKYLWQPSQSTKTSTT